MQAPMLFTYPMLSVPAPLKTGFENFTCYNNIVMEKIGSMNLWRRFWGHLRTVLRHKHHVFKNCVKAGIPWQGIKHDLSKFSPAEFLPGVRYFAGDHSPNEGERSEYGYSLAWMHHKGRNKHHYEYWNDYNRITREPGPVRMPLRYVVEMVCDRIAASKVYLRQNYNDSCPLAYFNKRKDRRDMHPDTYALTLELLTMLSEKGEDETFAYIKKLLKENKGKKRYIQDPHETL